MNIMKTNMLLLDNRIKKDDAGNTTIPAPVPSTTEPQAGMKALTFLGMQNLMANPKLAQGVGVMNDKMAETSSADSYVAPYSSNIAFQGKFSTAAKVVAMSAMLAMGAAAFTGCKEEIKMKQDQTVIVDVTPVVEAIAALRQDINENNKEQTALFENAIAQLLQIQAAIQSQTLEIEDLRAMLLGELKNGETQRSAILEAIIKLQNITEQEARDAVNKLLIALQNHAITEQQFWAQVQELLKENNSLLTSILAELKAAAEQAHEDAQSLLKVAKQIKKNGDATIYQQQLMIEQNNALIYQNNIIIAKEQEMLDKLDQLNLSMDELKVIAQLIGKSLEDVINMSKSEIVAAIKANKAELEITNSKLDEINLNVKNNTIDVKEAADKIIEILGDISVDLSEIKALLTEHFGKYDIDMAELKAYLKAQNKDVKKIAESSEKTAADIRNVVAILNEIKAKIKDGVAIDYDQLEEMFKRLNANQQMSAEEIIKRLDAFIAGQTDIANKLDVTNDKLDKLNFVVSNDILEAINNIGDNLEGIDDLNKKLDDLLATVKAFAQSFNAYAKYSMDAHDQEIQLLVEIKNAIPSLKTDLDAIIKKLADAELQRNTMNNYLGLLNDKADEISNKLGRIPTVDEFSAMLTVHDKANQEFYEKLIKAAQINPSNFDDIKDLLNAIKGAVIDFQGDNNKMLGDILNAIKALDKTAQDYNDKLNQIIDLLKNFEVECTCGCCDNQTINEGIIEIIS